MAGSELAVVGRFAVSAGGVREDYGCERPCGRKKVRRRRRECRWWRRVPVVYVVRRLGETGASAAVTNMIEERVSG